MKATKCLHLLRHVLKLNTSWALHQNLVGTSAYTSHQAAYIYTGRSSHHNSHKTNGGPPQTRSAAEEVSLYDQPQAPNQEESSEEDHQYLEGVMDIVPKRRYVETDVASFSNKVVQGYNEVPKDGFEELTAGCGSLPLGVDMTAPMNDSIDLSHIKPHIQTASYNLATYVNESATLSNLVKLGVDLSVIETKEKEVAQFLLTADFEGAIQPYLIFLYQAGVPRAELGLLLTKNPKILQEDLDNLKVRIRYLESKKFSAEAIGRIITKAPKFLCKWTKDVDVHLGYVQKEFKLTGDQVRQVVTKMPKILTWPRILIQNNKLTMKDMMGFTERELTQILMTSPKLYLLNKHVLLERFDYLHNQMNFSHERLLEWPYVLQTRLHIIKQRHLFLAHIGRDQYDPTKELYVSLKALVTGSDQTFCMNVAKVPVQQFNDFLKTL